MTIQLKNEDIIGAKKSSWNERDVLQEDFLREQRNRSIV